MKKLLALVLALVMSMSLVTISNAAFSDADKISHDEAVDVLNTLGVINGMPDGSFAPAGNVTRAEMAKMISIIMLGDVDASAFVGTATGLTDIKGHWAEGYIQYCYSQGIIAGKGDGTFAPNANVTAVEAAKMLLGAIGYNATVQGYTGADWAINVTRDAQLSGFYTDLKGLSSNKALTRDEAAQMIYNAVVADLIEKTPVLNVTTGTLQYEYRANKDKSLLTETFKAVKVVGVVVDNEFMSGSSLKGKTEIDITNGDENQIWGYNRVSANQTFKVTTGAAELGMSVTLYVKPYNANKTNAEKATVLGSAYVNDNNIVYTTGDQIKADKIEKTLKGQGLKLLAGYDVSIMKNYAWTGTVNNYADLAALTGNGTKVSFVELDGDGYIDEVIILEKSFGKVSSVSDKGDGLLNIAKIGSKGTAVYEDEANDNVDNFAKLGLAKDDYVSYYYVSGSEMYYVEKVEGKTVSVTATIGDVDNDGGKFVADATYKKSGLAANLNSAAATTLPTAVEPGKSAVVYLDDYGYVLYVTDVSTATTYLMVEDSAVTGSWNDEVSVKAILSDGTSAQIQVAKLKTSSTTTKVDSSTNASSVNSTLTAAKIDLTSAADNATKIFKYSVNTDGKYELTMIDATIYADSNNSTAVVTKNNPTITGTDKDNHADTFYADNSTPFVLKVNTDTSIYTGINTVPTRNGSSARVQLFAVEKSNSSFADVVFVLGGTGATSTDNYIYFLKDQPTVTVDAKGNRVYTYDVVRGGETTTIEAKSSTVVTKAGLYMVTFVGNKAETATANSDSRLKALAYANLVASSTSNGVVNGYFYNENTKFFVVKDNKVTEADASVIITEGKDRDQIAIILGDSTEPTTAKYVFIDRQNSAAAPTSVVVAAASSNAATVVSANSGDLLKGSVTVTGAPSTADQVKITITAKTGTTATATLNGSAYTSASDVALTTGTQTLVVTVTDDTTGNISSYTYTFTASIVAP